MREVLSDWGLQQSACRSVLAVSVHVLSRRHEGVGLETVSGGGGGGGGGRGGGCMDHGGSGSGSGSEMRRTGTNDRKRTAP